MAYTRMQSSRQRATVITSVVLVHAAVGYALVTGLAATIFDKPRERLDSFFVPDEIKVPEPPPPPPPLEKQVERQIDRQVIVPDTGMTLTSDVIGEIKVPDSGPMIFIPPVPSIPEPRLTAVKPIQAKPRNNPGTWATPDDYPSKPYRMGIEGVSRFHVTVGANGRVEGCTIIGTSGDSDLDAATCKLVTSRARFEPAKDGAGNKVTGEYSSSIRWVIPH